MSALLPFVLAGMASLSPERDHSVLGAAIAEVVEAERPLFADDDDRRRTASLVVAVAFREGSLGLRVEGDFRAGKPTSWCSMQIHTGAGRTTEGWSGPELRDDPVKCVTVGVRMLRESMRVCRAFPIAHYASGPIGCTNARAQRISRDRMALAERVCRAAAATLATEDGT